MNFVVSLVLALLLSAPAHNRGDQPNAHCIASSSSHSCGA
jgi:hypothetical protein